MPQCIQDQKDIHSSFMDLFLGGAVKRSLFLKFSPFSFLPLSPFLPFPLYGVGNPTQALIHARQALYH